MLISALVSKDILTIAVTAVAAMFLVLVCIPVHELAHGFVAYKLGDKSIKATGQLSLDPFSHIDPLGAFLIAAIGFGWGKPIRVNPYALKNRNRDMAIVAASGPLSNIILGFLLILCHNLVRHLFPAFSALVIGQAVGIFFQVTAQISIWLGVLNLLPIPMFDGFTILNVFLNEKQREFVEQNMQIISIIVIILLFSRILTVPIAWVSTFIISFFYWLTALPF